MYKEHIPVAQLCREIAAIMQEFTRAPRFLLCRWLLHGQPHKGRLMALACAESGGVRPFGVSLMLAGCDENGPQLYQIDPSGSYFAWKASAIGKNMVRCLCRAAPDPACWQADAHARAQVNAKTFLEKRYADDMELEDVVHTALLTLKEGFEGQISGNNIEVAMVGEDQKFRLLTPAEISDYLQEVE